jgi:hypothetical protein
MHLKLMLLGEMLFSWKMRLYKGCAWLLEMYRTEGVAVCVVILLIPVRPVENKRRRTFFEKPHSAKT